MEVKQQLPIYEKDGSELLANKEDERLGVDSHWNNSCMVVLVLGGGATAILCRQMNYVRPLIMQRTRNLSIGRHIG